MELWVSSSSLFWVALKDTMWCCPVLTFLLPTLESQSPFYPFYQALHLSVLSRDNYCLFLWLLK